MKGASDMTTHDRSISVPYTLNSTAVTSAVGRSNRRRVSRKSGTTVSVPVTKLNALPAVMGLPKSQVSTPVV